MNSPLILSLVTAGALVWATPIQERLTPADDPMITLAPGTDFEAAEWAEALRQTDLGARRKAYEDLLQRARGDGAIYDAIAGWAADTSRLELAWTAQLLQRELDQDPFRGLRSLRPRTFRVGPRQPGAFPRGADLDELNELIERMLEDPMGGLGHDWDLFDAFPRDPQRQGGSSSSEGIRIETGPDGVRVEVTETIDGKEQTQTYEAESMDMLLQAHPELEGRLGETPFELQLGDLDPFGKRLGDPHALEPFSRGLLPGPGQGLRAVSPRTDILGVRMLPPESRTEPVEGVASDVGLLVVEVLPGSLAARLGIAVGDVVVSIDGKSIASASDVKDALAKRDKDARLVVDVVDQHGEFHARTWQPGGVSKRRF